MSDQPKSTVTLSLRVTAKQAEHIRVAAFAANRTVSEYIKHRVIGKPILATPALAALAALMSALRRLEHSSETRAQTSEQLLEEVHNLCRAICDHEKLQ